MEQNKKQDPSDDNIPDPDDIRERFPIEDDSDTLEPFDDQSEHREINADDPKDMAFWATQFQISHEELHAAMALTGNSVRAIKKYLSI
ncbi:DUF3606 domain-containing protein [Pedobacter miscanthi]|uniref:DUF3606 domain-containing protein n=1 Tax=Pedobacter miscanthi TaxID=2259170 RepID=A0A366LD58_9SPHI|nr:DUF3606 domain-containing protein [Pedobacter miscanthi]RBQ11825.1 hypothetical protein DRW42_00680 [Pedobacter miscanthi]